MSIIKIIDTLNLDEEGVKAKSKYGKYQPVHLRQGDLDGACAVYSTMMILILIRALNYNDIISDDKRYGGMHGIERLKEKC